MGSASYLLSSMCRIVYVRQEGEPHRNERDITATDLTPFVLQLEISDVRFENESFFWIESF